MSSDGLRRRSAATVAGPASAGAESAKLPSANSAVGALDVGAHARSLFATPPARSAGFAALDGFRAFLSLWMVAYHSMAYFVGFYDDDKLADFSKSQVLRPLMIGPLVVDGFFVLTGFLLAYPLFEDEKKGKVINLKDWYYRRISRMVPLYVVVLVLYCQVVCPGGQMWPMTQNQSVFQRKIAADAFPNATHWPTGCETSVLNLLFISNTLPGGGCLGHTWSFAIQFQFYLLLPVLVKLLRASRKLVLALLFGVVVSIVMRVFAFHQIGTFEPKGIEHFFFSFFWYSGTITRFNVLLIGTLAAYLCTHTDFSQSLKDSFLARKLFMGVIALVLVTNLMWSEWYHTSQMLDTPGTAAIVTKKDKGIHHMLFYVFANVGGPLAGISFAYLVLAMVNSVGFLGRTLQAIFSHRLWFPIAQLSFCAYLIHPIVYVKIYATGRLVPLEDKAALINCVWSLLIVFSLSFVLYVLVEKPLDVWLRNKEHPRLATAFYVYAIVLIVLSVIVHPLFYHGLMTFDITKDGVAAKAAARAAQAAAAAASSK